MKYAILTHGGAGSSPAHADGCVTAAHAAREALERGEDALQAALAATVVLEDDPRFNAGTGSNFRLDGKTIEMDASAMTSEGRFGGVTCIQKVKNPVLVAAKVMGTPHLLLAGSGATAFARKMGFSEYDPSTADAKARYDKSMENLLQKEGKGIAASAFAWRKRSLNDIWNFDSKPPVGCDTVGTVVRDMHGRFAATASTGGTTYMLKGRIGDTPLMGCGIYAGPIGAVACTGIGEEITRRFLAKTVYDWLTEGMAAARAAQRGIAMFPEIIDVGILVVGQTGQAIASNRNMASTHLVG